MGLFLLGSRAAKREIAGCDFTSQLYSRDWFESSIWHTECLLWAWALCSRPTSIKSCLIKKLFTELYMNMNEHVNVVYSCAQLALWAGGDCVHSATAKSTGCIHGTHMAQCVLRGPGCSSMGPRRLLPSFLYDFCIHTAPTSKTGAYHSEFLSTKVMPWFRVHKKHLVLQARIHEKWRKTSQADYKVWIDEYRCYYMRSRTISLIHIQQRYLRICAQCWTSSIFKSLSASAPVSSQYQSLPKIPLTPALETAANLL
jgi:hypothetical protein